MVRKPPAEGRFSSFIGRETRISRYLVKTHLEWLGMHLLM